MRAKNSSETKPCPEGLDVQFLKLLGFGFGATNLIIPLKNNQCEAPGNLDCLTFLL